MKATLYVFVFTLAAMVAGPIQAQTDAETVGPQAPKSDDDEAFLKGSEEEEKPAQEEQSDKDADYLEDREVAEIEAPEEEKDIGRYEDPDTPYYSIGMRARWLMVPEWFVRMFGADIEHPKNERSHLLLSNPGIGPEFTYRKDGFDITAAIWYAGLGWDATTAFREDKGYPSEEAARTSWELIENDMRAIMITVDFIWSTSFTDWFAITYGAGLGLGIKWGDIIETESTNENSPDGTYTEKCPAHCNVPEGDTGCGVPYCDPGEDYGVVWDKLPVIPWVNFLFGMRFKPHRHFAIYVDAGFGLGFQWGGRLAYIF